MSESLVRGVYFIKNVDEPLFISDPFDTQQYVRFVKMNQPWNDANDPAVFRMLWLVELGDRDKGAYIIRNLNSGKYMTSPDGAQISHNDKTMAKSGEWIITEVPTACQCVPAGSQAYNLKHVSYSKLIGLYALRGPKSHKRWSFQRVSQSGAETRIAMWRNPSLKDHFENNLFDIHAYQVDRDYLILPRGFFSAIWKSIRERKLRPEIYDYDSFALVFKAAVATWGSDKIGADDIGILCGWMLGRARPPAVEGQKAVNFTLEDNYDKVVFFEPETGKFTEDMGYDPELALF